MSAKLSSQEKKLIFVAGLAVGYFFYYLLLLGPMLADLDEMRLNIANAEAKISTVGLNMSRPPKPAFSEFVFLGREEQIARAVDFINKSFKECRIDLVSLQQSNEGNHIRINFEFEAAYENYMKFLNLLSSVDILLLIDKMAVREAGSGLRVTMELVTAHR